MKIRETTYLAPLVHDRDPFDADDDNDFPWTVCGLRFAKDGRRYNKAEAVEAGMPTSCLWCLSNKECL